MVRVGLVGCGTIGSQLALAVERAHAALARIVALHDTNRAHATALQHRLRSHPPILSLAQLIRRSDLVLEAASVDAAADVATRALRAHRSVLLMSVGGLLRNRSWERAARSSRGTLYLPSGALAGLDGIKALAVGRITRASLTTRKPPRALAGAPYVQRRGLKLDRLTKPTVIFEGSAREAIKAFPQNVNVAAALTLAAGRAGRRATIRVVADPTATVNVHELEVEGDCGRIQCRIQSRPSANPKTSELAVRSAIATLDRMFTKVQVGT